MSDDSEEKIIAEWNKIWEPDRLSRAFGELGVFEPDTDMNVVYKKLKEYATGHGEKVPNRKTNLGQNWGFRLKMKVTNKVFMGLWTRAKKLRKEKKLNKIDKK